MAADVQIFFRGMDSSPSVESQIRRKAQGLQQLSDRMTACRVTLEAAHRHHRHGKIYHASERVFDGMLSLYDRSLRVTLKYRATTMLVSAVVLVATVYLFMITPKGFLPDEDTGQIFIFTEGAQGISFDGMVQHQLALTQLVMKQPWVESFMSTAAGGNAGRLFIKLTPRQTRKSAMDLVQELRPKLAQIPGITAYPQVLPPIRIGGNLTKSLLGFQSARARD